MYYQEKLIDGIWFYKTTPNGEWIKKSIQCSNSVLEEAASIKKSYDSARNMESMWTMKEEAFWRDKYHNYLTENKITDLDVSKYLYPASY